MTFDSITTCVYLVNRCCRLVNITDAIGVTVKGSTGNIGGQGVCRMLDKQLGYW